MGSGAGSQKKYEEPRVIRMAEGSWQTCTQGSEPGDAEDAASQAPERHTLHVGAHVKLVGLSAGHLNDTYATALSFDPQSGRWTLRLESGEEKAIKPENCKVEAIRIGALVRLTGLRSDTSLNGQVGTIESYDAVNGRWTVRLPGGQNKALKISNMEAVQRAPKKKAGGFPECGPNGHFQELVGSPLHAALHRGSIRLVRGDYFQRRQESGVPWQMRQEVDESDLWPPEQAAQLWLVHGSAFFLAVSYCWLGKAHSDPEQWQLGRLARVVREWRAALTNAVFRDLLRPRAEDAAGGHPELGAPPDVGVFLDFTCLHQQHGAGAPTAQQHQLYHEGMEVMSHLYGHTHTTVMQLTAVPRGIERRYSLRGWAAFESSLANNKVLAQDRVYCFDEDFDPGIEPSVKTAFLRKFRRYPKPPCSAEGFAELLWRCEEELKTLTLPMPEGQRLFTEAHDRKFALEKFQLAWQEQLHALQLDFKGCGWGDPEALQLSSLLPCFHSLESLNLSSNRIGDAGIEGLLRALSGPGSRVQSLDLTDNNVGAAAACHICALLPDSQSLKVLYLYANPLNRDQGARWQLTTAWRSAGKPVQNLVLDGT